MKTDRILPFRFIAAARYGPRFESDIESAMLKCMSSFDKLPGTTCVLVDVSGSMSDKMSGKTEMTRIDVACGLAIIAREMCEGGIIYSFSDHDRMIPARHGFALSDAIRKQANRTTEQC